MNHVTNSFPRLNSFSRLAFLTLLLALPLVAQSRSDLAAFQKISFKPTKICTVPAEGEVTSLVKGGVELSVTEDFDCDGIPDAYDNCIGIPNRDQADSDHNGIGDACEAATTVKAGTSTKSRSRVRSIEPAKRPSRSKAKETEKSRSKERSKDRKQKSADKHSHVDTKKRRRR